MLVLKWDSCRIHGLKITSKPRMGFLCLIHGLRGIGEEARGLAREKVLLWHRRPDTRWSALTWLPPQRRAGGCFSFMLLVQSPGGGPWLHLQDAWLGWKDQRAFAPAGSRGNASPLLGLVRKTSYPPHPTHLVPGWTLTSAWVVELSTLIKKMCIIQGFLIANCKWQFSED